MYDMLKIVKWVLKPKAQVCYIYQEVTTSTNVRLKCALKILLLGNTTAFKATAVCHSVTPFLHFSTNVEEIKNEIKSIEISAVHQNRPS